MGQHRDAPLVVDGLDGLLPGGVLDGRREEQAQQMPMLRGELRPRNDEHALHLRGAGVDDIVVADRHPVDPPGFGQESDLTHGHPPVKRCVRVDM